MFKYDSTHGFFTGTVEAKDGKLVIDGNAISHHQRSIRGWHLDCHCVALMPSLIA